MPNESPSELKALDENKQYYDRLINTILQQNSLKLTSNGSKLERSENPDIRVYVGRNLLEPDRITEQQIQKLQQSIENPETLKNGPFKGTVQIRANQQLIFHNVRGEVAVDRFQLARSARHLDRADEAIQQKSVDATNSSELPKKLSDKINSYEEIIQKQQQRIQELENKLAFLSESIGSIQNKSTSQWIASTVASTAKGFGRVVTNWAEKKIEQLQPLSHNDPTKSIRYFDALDMSVEQLAREKKAEAKTQSKPVQFSKWQERLRGLQSNLESVKKNFEQTVDRVQQRAEPFAAATVSKVIEPAVTKLLQKAGVIYSPQDDPSSKVSAQTASLYQRLSQGVDNSLPASIQLKQIAQAAFKQQLTASQIQPILSHAPKFQEISLKHGMNRANQFIGVAIAAAERQNRIDAQQKLQRPVQKQSQYQA